MIIEINQTGDKIMKKDKYLIYYKAYRLGCLSGVRTFDGNMEYRKEKNEEFDVAYVKEGIRKSNELDSVNNVVIINIMELS